MNRPSLTNWDLVWPLVFKLLCHVSSNWYLMFTLLISNLDFFFFIASFHSVCSQILPGQHPLPLCVSAWSKIRLLLYHVREICSYTKVLNVFRASISISVYQIQTRSLSNETDQC